MYDQILETDISDGNNLPVPEDPVEDNPVVVSGGDSSTPVVTVSGGDSSTSSGTSSVLQESDYSIFYEKMDSIHSQLNIVIALLVLSFCLPRIIHGIRRLFDNE